MAYNREGNDDSQKTVYYWSDNNNIFDAEYNKNVYKRFVVHFKNTTYNIRSEIYNIPVYILLLLLLSIYINPGFAPRENLH